MLDMGLIGESSDAEDQEEAEGYGTSSAPSLGNSHDE